MSFEKKLYDFEVNPPEMAWDKIAYSLDDFQFEQLFKKKLAALEVEPNHAAWENIISEAGAEGEKNNLAGKLANIQEIPPADNWRKIIAGLDKKTPVVPFYKKYNRIIRIAAAAAVIVLIVWGGISFINTNNNSNPDKEIVKEEQKQPVNKIPVITNPENNPPKEIATATQPEKEEQRVIASIKKKPIRIKPELYTINVQSETPVTKNEHSASDEIVADKNINTHLNKEIRTSGRSVEPEAPRYLVYMNDQGSLMKVSKKLADLKCIYSKDGEVAQDALASLNKKICDDIVKKWQEKLANAPFHSSFNPLELADILK
jgi:hypothetical protein